MASKLRRSVSLLVSRRALLKLWVIACGSALFLNQFPRMDEIHLLWSAGALLIAGALAVQWAHRRLLTWAPALARSAGGRAVAMLSLLSLVVVGVFPHVWLRAQALAALTAPMAAGAGPQVLPPRGNPGLKSQVSIDPMVAGAAGGADAAASAQLVPLTVGSRQVWLPAADGNEIGEVVALLKEKTAPGEPIFAYPMIPGFYYLADRSNATRFNHVLAAMVTPADLDTMVQQLEGVRYIVWDDGGAHFWVTPGDNVPVTEYIRTHFRVERFIGHYAVLARDAEGPYLPYYLPGTEPG